MKIGLINGNNDYVEFLMGLGRDVTIISDVKEIYKAYDSNELSLIVFTGGGDINPAYYNQKIGKHTSTDAARDEKERDIFNDLYNIPKLGICRGSQLLTVLSGGELIQHVDNHTISHNIVVNHNELDPYYTTHKMTSTHHQMMYPFNLRSSSYNVIATSETVLSTTRLNGDNNEIDIDSKFVEPEIVYYKETKALCIQGHPEFKSCIKSTKEVIKELIKKHLL